MPTNGVGQEFGATAMFSALGAVPFIASGYHVYNMPETNVVDASAFPDLETPFDEWVEPGMFGDSTIVDIGTDAADVLFDALEFLPELLLL